MTTAHLSQKIIGRYAAGIARRPESGTTPDCVPDADDASGKWWQHFLGGALKYFIFSFPSSC